MMRNDKPPKRPSYKVGYGQPPKSTRFRPGQSGNPKGRPKGSRNLQSIVNDVMRQKFTVHEGGRSRKLPALEVILRRLTNDAMRADPRAIRAILPLAERYLDEFELPPEFAEVSAEDRRVLDEYLTDTKAFTADEGEQE